MRLTVVSETGHGLGLAMHLSSEGHLATFVSANESTRLGNGLTSPLTSEPADLVVFDSHKFVEDAESLRKQGQPIIGTSLWGSAIDNNQDYADSIIRSLGWSIAIDDAGINLYVTVWFNGNCFISNYGSIVYRRLLPEGRGPDVGFMGAIGIFGIDQAPCTKKTILKPLERLLRKVNHHGPLNLHLLINKSAFSVKSINSSFSNPLSIMFFENSKRSYGELLAHAMNPLSLPVAPIDKCTVVVRLVVPPFPAQVQGDCLEIKGLHPGNLKHLWLVDVSKDNGAWKTAGAHGSIGYVSAYGAYPEEALSRVYRTINHLNIPNLQHREDIGHNLDKLTKNLRRFSWLP